MSKRCLTKHAPLAWQDFQTLHAAIAVGNPYDVDSLLPILKRPGFAGLKASDLFYAKESWQILVKSYQLYAAEQPFKDFFWTFRCTYLPIFSIFEAALPDARVYHAVSTGFGGLLGALAKLRTGRPFLLTEHGLYTREREIEIIQSSWIEQLEPSYRIAVQRMSFFQEWWFNTYRFMCQTLCSDYQAGNTRREYYRPCPRPGQPTLDAKTRRSPTSHSVHVALHKAAPISYNMCRTIAHCRTEEHLSLLGEPFG
jgi:Domain of unknown function (DUF3492)